MRLVPIEERTAPTTVPAYVCPMHPEVTSDKPGKCPKCGMKLVPTGQDGLALRRTPSPSRPLRPGASAGCSSTATRWTRRSRRRCRRRTRWGWTTCPSTPTSGSGPPRPASPGTPSVEITSEGLRLAGVQTAPAVRGTARPHGAHRRHRHRRRDPHPPRPHQDPGLGREAVRQLHGPARHARASRSSRSTRRSCSPARRSTCRARETAARFGSSRAARGPEGRRGPASRRRAGGSSCSTSRPRFIDRARAHRRARSAPSPSTRRSPAS